VLLGGALSGSSADQDDQNEGLSVGQLCPFAYALTPYVLGPLLYCREGQNSLSAVLGLREQGRCCRKRRGILLCHLHNTLKDSLREELAWRIL